MSAAKCPKDRISIKHFLFNALSMVLAPNKGEHYITKIRKHSINSSVAKKMQKFTVSINLSQIVARISV